MSGKVTMWLGVGVLATGMSIGGLAGAALAAADESSSNSPTSSSSRDSAAARASERSSPRRHSSYRSLEKTAATTKPGTSVETSAGDAPAEKRGSAARAALETVDEAEPKSARKERDLISPASERKAGTTSVADPAPRAEKSASRVSRDQSRRRAPRAENAAPIAAEPRDGQPLPAVTEFTIAAPDQQPAVKPSLFNVVGSFFWGLFDVATRLIDLPPMVPPGSTVTAGRSRLEIDCGDGYTADADWYFPTDGEPEKFIYFQHGFPARAGFYNVTLRELAEHNNAIVVAPSITSNIFACDACAAGGEPMHVAVAQLFGGDRAALLASARAAGYDGTLPEQFVFTGQSAGASTAVGAARYYWQFAAADEKSNMAGVLLYDVSALGGARTGGALWNALDNLPDHIPVLNIAAEPNTQNSQGSGNAVFNEKRPGQFNGVQLVGGAHSDAFRSSTLFGIPQFIVSVFFGASKPHNAEAVHVLTEGWLTDMYEGRVYDPQTRTGIYGDPGAPGAVVVDIPTDKGLARGYVLPALTPTPSPFDRLINAFLGLINVNLFARCAEFPDESEPTAASLHCAI